MTEDLRHRLDRLESLVERQQRTLDEQTEVIEEQSDTIADLERKLEDARGGDVPVSRRSVLKAGGALGLLGVGAGTATAQSDPTGQVGTEDRPIETLYADGLSGPLTDGDELTSLVGDGLSVEDGTLTGITEIAKLQIAQFAVSDVESAVDFAVDVTVEEPLGIETQGLAVQLVIVNANGTTVYDQTIDADGLAGERRTFTFGATGGTPRVSPLDPGEYHTTVTVTAANAAPATRTDGFRSIDGDVIETWNDLDDVRNDLTANYALAADLDEDTAGYGDVAAASANGDNGFIPLGDSDQGFAGTFFGGGHEIRDLNVDRPAAASDQEGDDAGLFGQIDGSGTVAGVELVDATVAAGNGGDTTNSGRPGGAAGGLAGTNRGEIRDSSVRGSTVTSGDGGDGDSAGDAGTAGSLVGSNHGTVHRSFGLDSQVVSGDGGDGGTNGGDVGRLGGLVGTNSGAVHTTFIGVGVTFEYGTPGSGETFDGDERDTGGLIGVNEGAVEDSYATNTVNGGINMGGLVGSNYGTTVQRSFSTGNVTGEETTVGGFVGATSGNVTNSFWDHTTSDTLGESDGVGLLDPGANSVVVTGLTTAEMQGDEAADNMTGFDFTADGRWATVDAENDSDADADDYPVLQALDRATQLEARA